VSERTGVESTVRHPQKPSPTIRQALKNPVTSPVFHNARDKRPDSGWSGMGEAWTYLSYIIGGVAVWGLGGYGLDRLLGTRPVFFVIGALVGNFAGIYLAYVRAFPKPVGPKPNDGGDRGAA
jgi:ATP synthase protein I